MPLVVAALLEQRNNDALNRCRNDPTFLPSLKDEKHMNFSVCRPIHHGIDLIHVPFDHDGKSILRGASNAVIDGPSCIDQVLGAVRVICGAHIAGVFFKRFLAALIIGPLLQFDFDTNYNNSVWSIIYRSLTPLFFNFNSLNHQKKTKKQR